MTTVYKVKVNNSEQDRDSVKIERCLWFSMMIPRHPPVD